jgi:hypothetical protein
MIFLSTMSGVRPDLHHRNQASAQSQMSEIWDCFRMLEPLICRDLAPRTSDV